MSELEKYTISYDREAGEWVLRRDSTARAVKRFKLKAHALQFLPGHFGEGIPGSVKIQHQDGTIEEERTYPRSMDPRESKG